MENTLNSPNIMLFFPNYGVFVVKSGFEWLMHTLKQTWGLGISGTTQGVYGWIPNPGFLGWMVIQHTHGFRVAPGYPDT
jgi:hypothetical protein